MCLPLPPELSGRSVFCLQTSRGWVFVSEDPWLGWCYPCSYPNCAFPQRSPAFFSLVPEHGVHGSFLSTASQISGFVLIQTCLLNSQSLPTPCSVLCPVWKVCGSSGSPGLAEHRGRVRTVEWKRWRLRTGCSCWLTSVLG